MSYSRYPEKNNPFADEDTGYGGGGRSFGGAYGGGVTDDISDEDFLRPSQRETVQQMVDNSQNRQLESTNRALASIYESERMGVATAEVNI